MLLQMGQNLPIQRLIASLKTRLYSLVILVTTWLEKRERSAKTMEREVTRHRYVKVQVLGIPVFLPLSHFGNFDCDSSANTLRLYGDSENQKMHKSQ